MCATKVQLVPLAVGLPVSDALLADRSISEQMVDKLDAEHLDLVVLLETTHVDVVTLRDVQEDTIDEEEEGLDIQELAPAETEVKEELSQALVVDALAVQLLSLALFAEGFELAALLQPGLLLSVHESLILLIELLATLIRVVVRISVFLLVDLLEVASHLVSLLLLLLLALQINFPVLIS